MLPGGHLAATYLLIRCANLYGVEFAPSETLLIISSGLLPDIDLAFGFINGKTGEKHHQHITHTPLGLFGIISIFSILFNVRFVTWVISYTAMLMHLFLDDMGYILGYFKIAKKQKPQINWLFPIYKYPLAEKRVTSYVEALVGYLKTYPIFYLEIVLIVIACVFFLLF